MLKLLRNPEIKKSLIVSLLIGVALIIAAWLMLDLSAAIIVALLSLFWQGYYLIDKYRYYQRLVRLGENLDQVLYHNLNLKLSDYTEGELSILASNIEKILTRMREQQALLVKDKHFLADSLADVSHQLRTPLASLNLLFNRLKQKELSRQDYQLIMQDIYRLLNQIERLLDNLLIIAKLDAGAIIFRPETVEVKTLIAKAIQPLEIKLELKDIDLQIDVRGELRCDLFRTAEALTNVIKNCLEHCSDAGVIKIKSDDNPLYLELTAEDNGTGFDPQDLPHIFERFYRGKNAAPDSIGIGLALARQIIHEQGGTLKASNKADGGALFTFRFYK
ncbi:MAG TPA: HAMP domain-containing histidine kinase [Clostridiaceae bacterium]|nr:HAMP domain-containing histidine kinase [Clostridiaceae bacterium]